MKNILLIGGSYGIGLSLVKKLSENFNVYTACRTNENLNSENTNFIKFDALNDTIDTSLLPDELHGFVYLPGSINLRPFKGLSIEAFRDDLEINLISLIKVLKDVMPKLTNSTSSSVVLMSTVAVQRGMPFHSSVAASKGAIEGLTKSLAAEYAPKVRVNAVAPSIVDTPLANRFLNNCLLYTSPSPRDREKSRMPSSA